MTAIQEQNATVVFNMANATALGINAEAGPYAFSALSYTNLWLNTLVLSQQQQI
jgi:hypothetical protein